MNSIVSSSLLAASMLLGQGSEQAAGKVRVFDAAPTPLQQTQSKQSGPAQPSAQSSVQPSAQPQPSRPIFGWFNREDRPLMSKFQSWFKREQPDPQPMGPSGRGGTMRETPAPPLIAPMPTPSNDFPRKLPNPASQVKTPTPTVAKEAPAAPPRSFELTTLQKSPAPQAKTKSPILAQFADKIGRDEKFEWITGQLELENGNYVIYYATPETIDQYNGRIVILPQQVDMKQFRRGDLVSARGQIAQRQSMQGMVPIYQVNQVHLIERPKS